MIGAIGYGDTSAMWRMSYASGVSAASAVAPTQESAPTARTVAAAAPAAASSVLPWTAELPRIQEGYGPVELAARTRVQFPDFGTPLSNALEGKLSDTENELEQEDP